MWTIFYNNTTHTNIVSSWILTQQSENMHNDCCYGNRWNKSGSRSLVKTTDGSHWHCSSALFSLSPSPSLLYWCVLFQHEISSSIQSAQNMCKYTSWKCPALVKLTNHTKTKRPVLVAFSFKRPHFKWHLSLNHLIRSLKAINAILYFTGQCCELLGRFDWCPFIDVRAHVTAEFKNTL